MFRLFKKPSSGKYTINIFLSYWIAYYIIYVSNFLLVPKLQLQTRLDGGKAAP
jgi:hypothetical protein